MPAPAEAPRVFQGDPRGGERRTIISAQRSGDKAPALLDSHHAPCSIASAKTNNRRQNMTEDEEREINPHILKARIDVLEWLLAVLIGTLSEDQKGYVKQRLADLTRNTQESAWRRDADPARNEAEIAYELEQRITNLEEDSSGGFAIYMEK